MSCKDIKILAMDVDGTLTDGRIYMGINGEIMKAFDVKDGCGIHDILIPAGISPVVITGRRSKILQRRCEEIGITDLYQGVVKKDNKLRTIVKEASVNYKNVAYIGDDINDISCMEEVKEGGGIVACPADAAGKVMELADYVCNRNGGCGAVREFIDWLTEN